ncbi:hypothetical protein P3T22_006697 [Paraburkholderia sp. GAS348]
MPMPALTSFISRSILSVEKTGCIRTGRYATIRALSATYHDDDTGKYGGPCRFGHMLVCNSWEHIWERYS